MIMGSRPKNTFLTDMSLAPPLDLNGHNEQKCKFFYFDGSPKDRLLIFQTGVQCTVHCTPVRKIEGSVILFVNWFKKDLFLCSSII